MLTQAELGVFSFSFQPNGKLESLTVAAGFNLLYQSTRPVEMAPGRFYTPAGWDECFPTIEPYGDVPFMGDLVGLPPRIEVDSAILSQTWRAARFLARRRFSLENAGVLRVDFEAQNISGRPQEVLWANHALLAVEHLTRVLLPDGEALVDFEMDGSERKWFLPAQRPVELVYPGFSLTLSTDQPWWGIWSDRGGWPLDSPNTYNCLGVEATNTAAEVPGGQWLNPGEVFKGWVRLAFKKEGR